ncbi:unnamed protein product [Discula destructiva]
MEERLPSYQEASPNPKEWLVRLRAVAPYVDKKNYHSLCLVSKHFYAVFAPLLFKSPLSMAFALPRGSVRARYEMFTSRISNMKSSTLLMIAALDFRNNSVVPVATLAKFVILYANSLRCLILDGRNDLGPKRLAEILDHKQSLSLTSSSHDFKPQPLKALAVLSLRDCAEAIPHMLFDNQKLSGLVYLDLSLYTGGSAKHLLHGNKAFARDNFPKLRVLKLAHMSMNSSTAASIFDSRDRFRFQLWSLDVSANRLDDTFIGILMSQSVLCAIECRLQSDKHFEVGGTLKPSQIIGVYFVVESDSSVSFSHPDRYLSDAPNYTLEYDEESRNRVKAHGRLAGNERIRGDTLDDAITALAGGAYDPAPDNVDWPSRVPVLGGLTHLRMNGTDVSLEGIHSMLESNCGFIEHFECDRAQFLSSAWARNAWWRKAPWLSSGTVLYGFPGSAHLIRPVYASNLRVLKIHHSVVTNTPTVVSRGTTVLENIWAAEKFFHGPIDLAYPQTYVPDMNPRVYSLTLAKIPRYSTGIVTERIIEFLRLLALQEQAIQKIEKLNHRRGPPLLRGLRHICLEFDPEVGEEMANLRRDDDVDQAMEDFASFDPSEFAESSDLKLPPVREPRPSPSLLSRSITRTSTASSSGNNAFSEEPIPTDQHGRFSVFPFSSTTTEYYRNGNTIVWIGNGILGSSNSPAVKAYMLNLTQCKQGEHQPVTVATPCHVHAGVPAGSYIFHDAWNRTAIPTGEIKRPTKAELAGMQDVQAEIKAFRLKSRDLYTRLVEEKRLSGEVGEHEFYRGRVEISFEKRTKKYEAMYEQ